MSEQRQVLTVGEVLERIKNGETMKGIADQAGTNTKKIQRALNGFGYQYERALQTWYWQGEGEEKDVQGINILEDRRKPRKAPKKKAPQKPPEPAGEPKAPELYQEPPEPEKTPQEAQQEPQKPQQEPQHESEDFKDMIRQEVRAIIQEELQNMKAPAPDATPFENKIRALTPGERKAKTFKIDESMIKQLDNFSQKRKVQKSEVLELALSEFFKTYDD